MEKYNAPKDATIFDVCMNTYGTLDRLGKLILDNNITNLSVLTNPNQEFIYDLNFVNDYIDLGTLADNNIKYVTGQREIFNAFNEPNFLLTEEPQVLQDEQGDDFLVD